MKVRDCDEGCPAQAQRMGSTGLRRALEAWVSLLGMQSVCSDQDAIGASMRDTSSFRSHVLAILKPHSSDQVAEIVRIAARERVSLYPVSTGHNWGYGTMNPPEGGCVLVHLGKLKEISIDDELGLATVEPGVTQQDMWDYLARLE